AKLVGVELVDLRDHDRGAVDLLLFREQLRQLIFAVLAAQRLDLALQVALLLEQSLHALDRVVGARAQHRADLFQPLLVSAHQVERALAGDRFDAPDAGGDAAFGLELEDADLAGAVDVRAAAELGGEVADLDHAHDVAVLVAEKSERASFHRLVVARLFDLHVGVDADALVHALLDVGELFVADRAGMAEVEAQPVRRDERAGLVHVLSQLLAQHRMKNVRRRMVERGAPAIISINGQADFIADLDASLDDFAAVDDELRRRPLRVRDFD